MKKLTNGGNTMTERKIKVEGFFGEREITKQEFIKRWTSPAHQLWSFFLDHNKDEADFGREMVERVTRTADQLFEKLYKEEK